MVEYLVPQDADHLKGLPRGHGVDEHVAMDADKVFGVEDAVFVLKASSSQVGGWLQQAVLGQCGWLKRLPDPPCRLSQSRSLDLYT